jgi:4-amino-4-deoxy-L-arabinose transferase-like glycosyltransferase
LKLPDVPPLPGPPNATLDSHRFHHCGPRREVAAVRHLEFWPARLGLPRIGNLRALLEDSGLSVLRVGALVGLGAGIVIRIYLARVFVGHAYSDNAIIALEAKHALQGRFYAFHWGQSYMGTLEALVIAPFFALLGHGELVLSIGLIPWFVLFALALYALTRRCGGRPAAVVAVWLAAFAPPLVLLYTVTPCGGYPETLVFGTTILWLTLRLVFDELTPRARFWTLLCIGGIAGLAFWSDWLVLPYFGVAGLYLLLEDPRLPLRPAAWLALVAFALGSAPLWVFNWHHHFATFAFLEGAKEATGRWQSLRRALFEGLPQVLGIQDADGHLALAGAGGALALAAGSGFVFLISALRRSWRALVCARVRDTDPKLALVLLGIFSIAIYAISIPARVHQTRYLLPLASATMPLLAVGLARLGRRAPWLRAALPAVLGFYALQVVDFGHRLAAEPTRNGAGPVEHLGDFLPEAGIRFAYADWSDAMITTYLTDERVIVTDYHERTYPLAEADPRDPAVILRDQPGATAATTLRSLDARFSRTRIPGYQVYWPIRYDGVPRAPLSRAGWKLTASVAPSDTELALDGDPTTGWSAPAAGPTATLTLALGREEVVTGVFFGLGAWPSNAFRRLRIEASTDGTSWEPVKDGSWDFPLSFRPDGRVSVLPDDVQMVLFPPRPARWLRIALVEGAYGHDWSVAELHVFGLGRSQGIELPRVADSGSPAVRVDWSFGGALRLLGYDWRPVSRRELELTYYWQAEGSMDRDYAASVHFDGPGQRFQSDYVLGSPAHLTHTWKSGEIVKQARRVILPRDVVTGTYTVQVGVWSPSDQRHLRLGPWWRASRAGDLLRLEVTPDGLAAEASP